MKRVCKALGCGATTYRARFRFCRAHWRLLSQDLQHAVSHLGAKHPRAAVYVVAAARFWILLKERPGAEFRELVRLAYPKQFRPKLYE